MRISATVSILLLAGAASAQVRTPAPPAPPPPPIFPSAGGANAKLMLIEFTPGEARCDGEVVRFAHFEAPFPTSTFASGNAEPVPLTLTFRIDGQGRPLGIGQTPGEIRERRLFFSDADVIPAFAASRFAPGGERKNCRITIEARAFAGEEAPLPLVRRYFVAPHTRQAAERALFRRIHSADTDCIDGRSPKVRLRAFPAFETIPARPGSWAYAMAGFDIDSQGKPINVRVVGSDGNVALDRAAIDAVKRSRFAPEARHGCTYPYHRRSETPLEAPPSPDKADFLPADARCPAGETGWTSKPRLDFPPGFVRRRIEGWAVIGYDVAPWGQTGNVRVLAAEPAAAFGERARQVITASRQAPSDAGRSGCVDLVRFVMAKPGGSDGPEAED